MAKAKAAAKSVTADVPFAVTEWPANRVETWPLDRIVPYEKNPRVHLPEQITLLAESMKNDGVTMPILVDENGVIIAGHGRLMAAQLNKFEEYPVIIARGWSEAKKKAARIRDNQIGLLSRWDDELLRVEVGELKLADYDLTLLGFEPGQLAAFSMDAEKGLIDPTLEWMGMPEFSQANKEAFRSIIVHFKDQAAVDLFVKTLGIKITENTRFLWYPEIEIEAVHDKRYKA